MIPRAALLLLLLLILHGAAIRISTALSEARSRLIGVEEFLTELQGRTLEIPR
ncbi:MAG: hypothetical protein ACLFPW_09265 [Spirochaetaceae bacterium]